MIIYKAHNTISESCYIGKTIKSLQKRKTQHKSEAKSNRTNSIFHKAIRKYGFDVFIWEILEKHNSEEELNEAEIRIIRDYRENNIKIYNLADGGEGGDVGGSKYWKEHGIAEETKIKISESLKEYYRNNTNPMKGKKRINVKPHSKESIEKMRKAKLGKPRSEETKQKLREANLGKKLKPHVIEILSKKFSGKNNPSATPIICVTTGEYFDYAKLAAIKYNSDLSAIIKCCKGKAKTVKGKIYKYAE